MRACCERGVPLIVIALLAVALLAIANAAAAQPARGARPTDQGDFFQSLSLGSHKEPVHINADALELDYRGNTLTYSGNVQVTQGDVTLTSDRLAITYDRDAARRGETPARAAVMPAGTDADKIKEVVAEGHVRIHKGDRLAEGQRAVFDQAKQTIVLSDGAVLHEGPNQVAGDRIVVYLQEERSVVESGSNSRVSAVFYPGTHEAEAAATPPKAPMDPHAPATVQMGAANAPVAGEAR